jgi:nucleoside-diphosphate-sugar epimerase
MDIIQPYWICSVEKAKQHFNWQQKISLEQGIYRTVEWYQQYKWL